MEYKVCIKNYDLTPQKHFLAEQLTGSPRSIILYLCSVKQIQV